MLFLLLHDSKLSQKLTVCPTFLKLLNRARVYYFNLQMLEWVDRDHQTTLKDLFDSYDPYLIHSTPGIQSISMERPGDEILVQSASFNVRLLISLAE